MSRFRNFCFTINNPTPQDETLLSKLPVNYIVYGQEVGESGTSHFQGYAELSKQLRLKSLKAMLPRAHIEKRKGTAKQAADYCKKDGKYTEKGIMSRPGARTDIEEFVTSIKAGATDVQLIEEHPTQFVRYYKAADRIRLAYAREDKGFSPVEVIVLWGKCGRGKTRYAYDNYPDLYRCKKSAKWFDGYFGQETILIDEFYGQIAYWDLLELLDGYKYDLPVKGGFTWKRWKRVIITSNDSPETWYPEGLTPALKRRITRIEDLSIVEGGEAPQGCGYSITPQPLSQTSESNFDEDKFLAELDAQQGMVE